MYGSFQRASPKLRPDSQEAAAGYQSRVVARAPDVYHFDVSDVSEARSPIKSVTATILHWSNRCQNRPFRSGYPELRGRHSLRSLFRGLGRALGCTHVHRGKRRIVSLRLSRYDEILEKAAAPDRPLPVFSPRKASAPTTLSIQWRVACERPWYANRETADVTP